MKPLAHLRFLMHPLARTTTEKPSSAWQHLP